MMNDDDDDEGDRQGVFMVQSLSCVSLTFEGLTGNSVIS